MFSKDDDNGSNNSGNRTFQEVIEARMSRRGFLGGGLATAAALSLGGVSALLKAVPASAQNQGGPLLGFQNVPVSTADEVVVPPGIHRACAHRLGRPGFERPGFQARREQQRCRSGPAVGHAQRRRSLFPDQRFGARSDRAE